MIVLNVGHSIKSKGACNEDIHLCEFDFNNTLSKMIMKSKDINDVEVVYQNTYAELPNKINALNPRFTISMHANAYAESPGAPEVGGTEVLYWEGSSIGEQLALLAQYHFVKALGLQNRGIKARSARQRGSHLLQHTTSYTIICEPFFIDNTDDLRTALIKYDELVQAYIHILNDIRTL